MKAWEIPLRLILAVLLSGLIGFEREQKNRPAGMRTHILVCLGAALIAVMECLMVQDMILLNQTNSANISLTWGRISAQVISGVGFLGAGTIFVSQKHIAGLTTAASVWNVACLGLTIGMGHYALGISACLVMLFVLHIVQRFIHAAPLRSVEIEFNDYEETLAFIHGCFGDMKAVIRDTNYQSTHKDTSIIYKNAYTLSFKDTAQFAHLVERLSKCDSIISVRTRSM